MATVRDLMTTDPACCSPDAGLGDVARLMVEQDCGEIPVLDDNDKPLGVITDRDIVVRAVAKGKNPMNLTAQDWMTSPAITISEDASVDECCELMEDAKIRRVVVTNENGTCIGIIAQADIAEKGTGEETVEILRAISEPAASSQIH